MVKVYIIAIVMFWADPTATPTNDSVEITHLHGLPLYFETVQGCSDHINQNIDALKEYGSSSSGASIGDIIGAALEEGKKKTTKSKDEKK